MWITSTPNRQIDHAGGMTIRRRVLWTGALAPWLVAAVVWAVVQAASPPAAPPSDPATRGIAAGDRESRVTTMRARASGPDWPAVLDRLDRRRELAYASEDPTLLRAIYVSGSPVLRHDLAMLRAYAERGVRLTGVRLRILDARLLGRFGRCVRLRVVDRLERPMAHGAEGAVPLPRDRATSRVMVLRGVASGWRIAAVRRAEV
jgi:hypothetical protein